MNFKEIKELIELIDNSNLSEVKIERDGLKLTVRTNEYPSGMASQMLSMPQMTTMAPQAPMVQNTASAPQAAAETKAVESAAQGGEDSSGYVEVRSPMVGTFYRAPAPDKPPYVAVGDNIKPNSVVCIIEAMKLFNEVEAEVRGKIVKVLVEDAAPVEYDQPLFLVDPNA